jgi:predicted transcriptional regulator
MGELIKIKDHSTRELVLKYITSDPGEVTLTEAQAEMMEKWRYADEVIRKGELRTRESIAQHLMQHFNISRDTAFRYMSAAEYVWSSSYPLNKRYEIAVRIDFVKQKIDELYKSKDYKEAVQLEKVLQGYYDSYPQVREKKRPGKTIFNIGNLNMLVMPAKEAEAKADSIIQTFSDGVEG